MRTQPDELRTYGEYDIESLLGKGSIGQVFLARHRRIGRRVALKTVRPEHHFDDDEDRAEFYKRLQREAELCASLHHPNIVLLYEVGYADDEVSYLATEYVAGESLLARLKRTRPLPLNDALSIGTDVLRGLDYAHRNGIIHRDIKPGNVLLTREGRAKIADFGVARPLDSSLTGTNSLLGTPNYMSPEQVKSGPVTTRADLFSAGILLYEMLTGVKPFAANELSAILYNVVNLDPPLASAVNPDVPEPVARIVARLLAKSPADRYATAGEALRDLEQATSGAPTATPTTTIPVGGSVHEGDDTAALHPVAQETPAEISSGARSTERERYLVRHVSPAVFWIVTLGLAALLVAGVGTLQLAIQEIQPQGVMTRAQLATFLEKRKELADARAFAAAGKYDEAVKRYDALLAKYPQSLAARAERDAAQQILEKNAPKVTLRVVEAPPRPGPEKPKASRWERIKRFFHGHDGR